MTTQTLAAMTSLNKRAAIAAAAVVLSALQFAGLANLTVADTQLVVLDRVEIVGQRDVQPTISVAQNAIGY